ncbi:MAG: SirB2 family protein [Rudaea sp.]|nr:SirB2 family protein [Rudaea sp.]
MIEFYAQIKFVHVAAVVASGSLFMLRGLLMLAGSRFANHAALRYLSYTIDTTLLTAALMLVMILHQYPFMQTWLTVKVLLLVVYIVLGVFALRRGRTRAVRAACFGMALAVFAFIIGVAIAHDPRGWMILLAH